MLQTRRPPVRLTGLTLLCLTSLTGCGEGGKVPIPELPHFDDGHLGAGRSVWMSTCRNCHLLGIDSAAAVTDFAKWDQYLTKDREQLYQSVIGGMTRPDGSVLMPPRGGNPQLSDAEVKAAVDYNLAAVEALRASWTP